MKKKVWDKEYKGKKSTIKGKKGYAAAKAKADAMFGKKTSLVKNMWISKEMKKKWSCWKDYLTSALHGLFKDKLIKCFYNHKEKIMPMVGKKKYSYTKAGMKKAKAAAKKAGKKVSYKKKK